MNPAGPIRRLRLGSGSDKFRQIQEMAEIAARALQLARLSGVD
jgi:hypothetical protein